ncbi:hypothetical protein CEXT_664921 [Caerostris extrusa]|uniref:Uncharacterized protein n=1 Tax=Caerostris extrusa TaxID=172846 RepID=A0AAV4SXL9_CAEEX|nr:hypothetical protein CEXT_664921 [Caerostris extrusa]
MGMTSPSGLFDESPVDYVTTWGCPNNRRRRLSGVDFPSTLQITPTRVNIFYIMLLPTLNMGMTSLSGVFDEL